MSAPPPPPALPEGPVRSELERAASRGLLTRRTLLAMGGVGGALVVAGGWAHRVLLRAGPPAPGFQVLSAKELAIAEAVADAFFPGPPSSPLSGREVELGRFMDRYLADLYESERDLFRLVFRWLEVTPYLGHRTAFTALPLEARQEVLEGWHRSGMLYYRAAYHSMRFAFAMGYFEDGRVRRALGLRMGCDLSERFPELSGAEG